MGTGWHRLKDRSGVRGRDGRREGEREKLLLFPVVWQKDDSFPLELALPSLGWNLTCRQVPCHTQLTRLPRERCRKPDSLLLVGKRPPQQVSLCTESVREVPPISHQPALWRGAREYPPASALTAGLNTRLYQCTCHILRPKIHTTPQSYCKQQVLESN